MTKQMDTKIKELANAYWDEFQEIEVDGEWSGTAYEDLGSLKSELDWADFHFALHTAIKDISSGIDEGESETSNFSDGVFVI